MPGGLLSSGHRHSDLPNEIDIENGPENNGQGASTVFDAVQKDLKLQLLKKFLNATVVYAMAAVSRFMQKGFSCLFLFINNCSQVVFSIY